MASAWGVGVRAGFRGARVLRRGDLRGRSNLAGEGAEGKVLGPVSGTELTEQQFSELFTASQDKQCTSHCDLCECMRV